MLRKFFTVVGMIIGCTVILGAIAWPFFHVKNYLLLPGTIAHALMRADSIESYGDMQSSGLEDSLESVVLIQAFGGGNHLKESNGVVITRDGLIAGPTSVLAPDADFYQVFIDQKPYRARVVKFQEGIVLFSIRSDDITQPIGLSVQNFDQVSIVSKSLSLNTVELNLRQMVINTTDLVKQDLTLNHNIAMYGASVMSQDGQLLGITAMAGMIPSSVIQSVFNSLDPHYGNETQ